MKGRKKIFLLAICVATFFLPFQQWQKKSILILQLLLEKQGIQHKHLKQIMNKTPI